MQNAVLSLCAIFEQTHQKQ